MTQKQMVAFLRSEGWKRTSNPDCWRDPAPDNHTTLPNERPFYPWRYITYAYRLARRRKAQRDRAALKRAGWEYHVLSDGQGNIYTRWCWSEKRDNGKSIQAGTLEEAVRLQAKRGGPNAQ